jgi:signal transduction histidine kinase
MKHSPPGEPVVVSASKGGAEVTISVDDRGPGIPDEDRERLFEKFQTGAGEGERGLGLGLYVARQVVEAHGGSIWYETNEHGGASFSFTLPIRRFRS